MHGIRIKEFHGNIPLWILLERMTLISDKGIENMKAINSNNNKNNNIITNNNATNNNNHNNNDNNNYNDSNHYDSNNKLITTPNNTKNTKNDKNSKKNISNNADIGLPDALRQTVGQITEFKNLKNPLSKSRAWMR